MAKYHKLKHFLNDEHGGATTMDYLIGVAAIVGLGVAVMVSVTSGTNVTAKKLGDAAENDQTLANLRNSYDNEMASRGVASTDASLYGSSNTTTSTTNGDTGGGTTGGTTGDTSENTSGGSADSGGQVNETTDQTTETTDQTTDTSEQTTETTEQTTETTEQTTEQPAGETETTETTTETETDTGTETASDGSGDGSTNDSSGGTEVAEDTGSTVDCDSLNKGQRKKYAECS